MLLYQRLLVLYAITEIEFAFSMILPFVFKIGSSTPDWELRAITLPFIVMRYLPSVLYPIAILLGLGIAILSMKGLLKCFTTMTLSQRFFLLIVIFMKHSPTGWRLSPPALDTNLLYLINFGFGFIWLWNFFSKMILMGAPVSNRPVTLVLLIIRLYNIGVVVFISSI